MKLNEKIYYYRTRAKLSQEQLAAEVGVSRQAVSKWELGDSTPEVGKLVALAKLFGITTDELLSEDEPDAAKPEPEQSQTDQPAAPEPAYQSSAVRQEDWLDRLPGFLGGLFRRYGWLAGVYVALSGLGFTIVGGIARFMFGQFFRVSLDSFSQFGTGGFTIEGGEGLPPEAINQIKDSLGFGPDLSGISAVSDIGQTFIGIATGVMVVGIVIMVVGVALALWLYKRGHQELGGPKAG